MMHIVVLNFNVFCPRIETWFPQKVDAKLIIPSNFDWFYKGMKSKFSKKAMY
jgi:hypothetical protein